MKIGESPIQVFDEDEDTYVTIGHRTPAVDKHISMVLGADYAHDNGRSEWCWFRLNNGDLILGVYPQGDTYLSISDEIGV